MANDQEPEPPVLGLRCPKCHCCDLRCVRTMRVPGNRIRRYKRCRYCNHHITTLEVPAFDLNQPKKLLD